MSEGRLLWGLMGKRILVSGQTMSTRYDVLSDAKLEKGMHGDWYVEVLMVEGNGVTMRLYEWEVKGAKITLERKPAA